MGSSEVPLRLDTVPAGELSPIPRARQQELAHLPSLIEPNDGLICPLPDPLQRRTARDTLLDRDLGKQGAAALLLASHQICCR